MKIRLGLSAYVLILSAFVGASIAAGADEARIRVAMIETSQQAAGAASGQQRPPRDLQMAQQCRSGRDDCLTRPQGQCGPGFNDCLSLGQSNCRDAAAAPYRPGVNTAGIDNALKNPNLPPEQRASLLATKERIEKARSGAANFQSQKCLINVVNQCRVTHC
jgi:hypothetical protein